VATTTTNYAFTLPAVADPIDEDLWGTELNTNFSSLDTILGARTASKYGALIVQNATDNGFDTITSQGTSGQVLTSNGADALPSFQSASAPITLANVYPVGSLYWNKTDSTSPATLFGFGTWVQITDKFMVARGSTYTSTGGSASVTLSEANLPSSITVSVPTGTSDNSGTGSGKLGRANTSSASSESITLSSVGSSSAFDILPPYQAAYCWERTA